MYLWGFGGLSDANNTLWIGIMAILFFLTLPGSLILLVVGVLAAFSGKTGAFVAGVCVVLSVANAHLMGMVYFGGFKSGKEPT